MQLLSSKPIRAADPPPAAARRRSAPRRRRLVVGVGTAVLVAGLPALDVAVAVPAAADSRGTIRDLQRKRDEVRRQRANAAAKVDALQATDAQVSAALDDLHDNVNAETDRLEEAKRAVAQAQAEEAQARQNEATAAAELEQLRTQIRSDAVEAYVNDSSQQDLTLLSVSSLNDVSSRKAMYEVKASKSLDALERYRAVQEDLGIARGKAESAAQAAADHQKDVDQRLQDLQAAQDEQERFSDQVNDRIDAALSEADALSTVDTALSATITQRQAALAAQLAAQRAAASRRGGRSSPRGGAVPVLDTIGGAGIVSVRGIRVSSSIADALGRMLAAADAAGVSLSGGGFRDPGQQVALRRSHCGSSSYAIYQAPASACSPPTARPGQSQHERGLAIDFTQGGRTLSRGSAGYQWLAANANSYGFFNLPSEAWHWSTTGK